MYDLIVIGLGPAGMNACIYAKEAGLNVLGIEKETPGGILLKDFKINNYLGFKEINSSDLALKMFEHFNSFNIPYKKENVMEIVNQDNIEIKTNNNSYLTKNLLITTGIKRKNIKNLDKFIGQGVSYCTVCDAALYKDKDVLVISNSLDDVSYLKDIVNNLYFIHTENKDMNINNQIFTDYQNIEKQENKFIINNEIQVDGIFINIGTENTVDFDKNLNIRNEKGFIEVDKNMQTKEKHIYAAGDVIEKDLRQICTATAEAAIAVNHIKREK